MGDIEAPANEEEGGRGKRCCHNVQVLKKH